MKKFDNKPSWTEKNKRDNTYKLSSQASPFQNLVSDKFSSLLSAPPKIQSLLSFRKARYRILGRSVRPLFRDAIRLSKSAPGLFGNLRDGKGAFSRLFSPEERLGDLRNLYTFIDYKGWFNSLIFKKLLLSFGIFPHLSVRTFLTPLTTVKQLTAQTILVFVLRRLKKYYFPQEIFPRLLNASKNFNFYTTIDDPKGLSFVCSGRVTRRQMASRYKYQTGATSKGTIESPLDYAQGVVPLKYGTVGVKVYFTQSSIG